MVQKLSFFNFQHLFFITGIRVFLFSKDDTISNWWQLCSVMQITPLPGAWPQKPGSATFPFFGVQVHAELNDDDIPKYLGLFLSFKRIQLPSDYVLFSLQPVIVDEKGQEIEGECSGYLCVKSSWPGAFRTLYGDHERYETTYFKPFPGYYFTGDGCSRLTTKWLCSVILIIVENHWDVKRVIDISIKMHLRASWTKIYFYFTIFFLLMFVRDNDGYHWLTGRVDDVINVR